MTPANQKKEQGVATAEARRGIRDQRKMNPKRLPSKFIPSPVGLAIMKQIGEPTVKYILDRMSKEMLRIDPSLPQEIRSIVGDTKRRQWKGENIPGYGYHRKLGMLHIRPTTLDIRTQPLERIVQQHMAYIEGVDHDIIDRLLHPNRPMKRRD